MNRTEIEENVKKVLVEYLGIHEEDIKPESHFYDDLGADSLDTVEIIMAVEENFDIEIPDEDAETLVTYEALLNYITNKFQDEE